MTTGRTHVRFSRVYIDGYDMSGYTRSYGPIGCNFDEGIDDAINLSIKGAMPGNGTILFGTLNGLFDNTATSGIHAVLGTSGVSRNILVGIGIQAAPANNDPSFAGQFIQNGYYGSPEVNPVTASVPFGNRSANSTIGGYANPFGVLLHALAAETAANTAIGRDESASSTKGGWMMYQATAGNGTAALKVQHASTNLDGSFADLLTSGTISFSSPTSGIVALAKNVTVNRYTRFQIALGTATTVTFAISWHRNLL